MKKRKKRRRSELLRDRAYLALNGMTAPAFTFDCANEEASRNAPALEILGSLYQAE